MDLILQYGKAVALFKSGDKLDCNNYRPIAILPTLSKILERAVHRQLYDYMIEHNILMPKQFGFRPKLSTVAALTHFTDTIQHDLDNGTGAAFLNLRQLV